MYLLQFPIQFSRPTSQKCPRFNLNLGMWLWLNFMTLQHSRPLIGPMFIMKKYKVLQLGLQLDFPIATNTYNSWYLYNLEFYRTSCSKCSGHLMSYIISYIQCNSHTTICNFFATNIHVKFPHAL